MNSTIQVIGGEKCVNSHKTATFYIMTGENSGLNSHNIKPCSDFKKVGTGCKCVNSHKASGDHIKMQE